MNVFCDIGCSDWAGGMLFVFHFNFQFGVHFFHGRMFGRCLCALISQICYLACCLRAFTSCAEIEYDLRLYFRLLACWDVRCYGLDFQVANSFIRRV